MTTILDVLQRISSPCSEGSEWLADRIDVREAWESCHRADWLLWAAVVIKVDRPLVVKAVTACARTALPLVPAGDDRPLRAIEAAEKWADSPTEENRQAVRTAAKAAADAAADAAAKAAAKAAAYYAAYAAHAAHAAAYYAAATADATVTAYAYVTADVAADAIAAAAADEASADDAADAAAVARKKAWAEMAILVRAIIPLEAVLEAFSKLERS
jgi:hypothetical protein